MQKGREREREGGRGGGRGGEYEGESGMHIVVAKGGLLMGQISGEGLYLYLRLSHYIFWQSTLTLFRM